MKDTFKMGAKIFGRIVLANVMAIITVISLSFLSSILFTKVIGYQAYGYHEDSVESSGQPEQIFLYEHLNENGEDTKLQEYVDNGYNVTTRSIRSQMSKTGNATYLIVSAIFTLALAGVLTYHFVWTEGNKDLNRVKYGHIKENKFKGVFIGLIAAAPYILLILILGFGKWAFAEFFPVVLYKFINASFYSLIELICKNAYTFGELSALQISLLVLVQLIIPVFTGIAYYIGYKDILISEKLTYKKEIKK